jgi:tetratricopeptide (TPR) repeat protein
MCCAQLAETLAELVIFLHMRPSVLLMMALCLGACRPNNNDFEQWTSPAATELKERIAKNPEDATAYYRRGYAASHIGDLKTVNESYAKAIQLAPTNQWFQISYGWALFNAGDFPAAKDQWLKAYDFCDGQHPENRITVALGLYGVKEFEKAAAFYDRQVDQDQRFATFAGLQEATAQWTWREKQAVYDLFDIWRYSYR